MCCHQFLHRLAVDCSIEIHTRRLCNVIRAGTWGVSRGAIPLEGAVSSVSSVSFVSFVRNWRGREAPVALAGRTPGTAADSLPA